MNRRALNLTDQSRSDQRLSPAGRRGQLGDLTRAIEALTFRVDRLPAEMCSFRHEVLNSLGIVTAEVRSLRRGRQTGSAIVIEKLCTAVHAAYGQRPFTASTLFEAADESGNESLGAAIDRTTNRKPSVRGLARFLKRSIGPWGPWIIRLLSEDGRDGNQYVIEKRPRY